MDDDSKQGSNPPRSRRSLGMTEKVWIASVPVAISGAFALAGTETGHHMFDRLFPHDEPREESHNRKRGKTGVDDGVVVPDEADGKPVFTSKTSSAKPELPQTDTSAARSLAECKRACDRPARSCEATCGDDRACIVERCFPVEARCDSDCAARFH